MQYCILKSDYGVRGGAPVYAFRKEDTSYPDQEPTATLYCCRTYKELGEVPISDVEVVAQSVVDFDFFFPRLSVVISCPTTNEELVG